MLPGMSFDHGHPEPFPSRTQPVEQVSADKTDRPDPVLAAAEKEAPGVPRHVLAAAIGAALEVYADETPDHYGPGTQTVYAAWLREQASALRGQRVRPRRKLI